LSLRDERLLEKNRCRGKYVRVPRLWELVGWWISKRKLRLTAGFTCGVIVLAAVLTVPGPRPVTISPPNPVGLLIGHTQPDASATAGKPRFVQKPPRIVPGKKAPALYAGDGIPTIALNAYIHSANTLAVSDPTCGITWEDLAGIGRVESDNGQTWGSAARVSPNGTLYPPILGPALDGLNGMPAIPTTDHGVLEHDPLWAHAVGPMQFLPSTWYAYAQDGNGDGISDPENFYDAALTAGVYLCKNGGDMATPAGLTNAIYAYNHSSYYVQVVEEWIGFYTQEGANALLAAGQGLLPTGNPTISFGGPGSITLNTVPAGAGSGINGSVGLATAAATSDGAGSFTVGIQAYVGSAQVTTGTASVIFPPHEATMSLTLGGGVVQVRILGGKTWVLLPPSLTQSTGGTTTTTTAATGTSGTAANLTTPKWQILNESLINKLPDPIGRALAVLSYDLVWVIAQFEGGTSNLVVEGVGTVNGVDATNYLGSVNLLLAGELVKAAASDLGRVASLLQGQKIGVDAWVDNNGLLRSAVLYLPGFPGVPPHELISVDLSFTGYGKLVFVSPPTTSTSTTTTSTSTTSTSTTTSSSSTSTSSTSTTSTTTTTTSSSTSTTVGPTTSTVGNTGGPTTTSGGTGGGTGNTGGHHLRH
jgi:hypothetical protein